MDDPEAFFEDGGWSFLVSTTANQFAKTSHSQFLWCTERGRQRLVKVDNRLSRRPKPPSIIIITLRVFAQNGSQTENRQETKIEKLKTCKLTDINRDHKSSIIPIKYIFASYF